MKKLIERLLIFILGIPAVFALVVLLPYCNHLVLNIFVIFFTAAGAVEFSIMLGKKQIRIPKAEAFILGALAPLAATLNLVLGPTQWIAPLILMSGFGWVLISRIFSRSENMENIVNYIIGGFSVMVYPGFFTFWIVKMSMWNNSGAILLFLFLVFSNDSAAWLFGSLFGKNNRGIIQASPNKSISGFLGGILVSLLFAGIAALLFPFIFTTNTAAPSSFPLLTALILGLFTGIFATLGDLAESAIKRSCDFKDSGNSVLGRGGVLDSIDSIAVAAPVFFLLFTVLVK